jgi:hypothetical protein
VIRFQKNYTNNVVVTLTENSTVSNPIYLFLFTNQTTNVNYYFIANDTSLFKDRYNSFIIIEGPCLPIDTLSGFVELGLNGFYDYTIYQTSLTNVDELDSANDAIPYITKTVEVGIVDVVLTEQEIEEYEVQSNTNIVYQPE